MMVNAALRPLTVKAGALRRQGYVPAVLYGAHIASLHVSIQEKDLVNLFDHVTRSTPVEVRVDGKDTYHVFLKDIQVHPVTARFLHLDLYVADPDRPLEMHVPVRFLGTARGIRDGGILEAVHPYIPVQAMPAQMPARIEVDVSNLGVGDSILIKDLPWAEGVQPLPPPEDAVVAVVARRALEVEAPVAEEAEVAPVEGEEEKPTGGDKAGA
ncbi:TPA: 50S ribosomal protein L25 [Candidatus Acetothermia bacterium]|nr:50S ribosomal protein L25 [Candidatus Acetothermia bacterium]HAZ30320.1 50S ribosomal protein L25 [Candidatus Acetothermia bacterium]